MEESISNKEDEKQFQFPEVIELNVGGRHFQTTLTTLTKYRYTMLGAMFSGKHHQPKDKDGRYFIDADGDAFAYILRYLRHHELPPRGMEEEVYTAAQYFGLHGLMESLESLPRIAMKKIEANYLNHFENMEGTIRAVIETAVCLSRTQPPSSFRPRFSIITSVREHDNNGNDINHNHCCAFTGRLAYSKNSVNKTAHIMLVMAPDINATKDMYVDLISKLLAMRGYQAPYEKVGNCNAGFNFDQTEDNGSREECNGQVYEINLMWERECRCH